MFTGLIEHTGTISSLVSSGSDRLMVIASGMELQGVRLGDSIAINGVCLTVVNLEKSAFAVQISDESRKRTTFAFLQAGALVNLERAMVLGARLDGHLVQGHVDAVGQVDAITPRGRSLEIWFRVSGDTGRYIVAKGSIAVDGVSLTVNQIADEGAFTRFSVNLIPHTQTKTTLSQLVVGRQVNVETDIIGRYVERLLGRRSACPAAGGLDEDKLRSAGFL
ncbi:MAG: riboflavin synthase [Magnetococcales bacterium]|nr:riboflavin synthase [Magnetococcales bacterium]